MKKAAGWYVIVVAIVLIVTGFLVPKPKITPGQKNSTQSATQPAKQEATKSNLPMGQTNTAQTAQVLVTRVVDGDTIEIEGGQKVRYIGIDTPETVDPRRAVGCFGKEASNENKKLVEGQKVRLEKDVSETDRYGRLLRYVYVGNTFVNEFLVKEGFAHASSYPPDIKYQEVFRSAQIEARNNNKGLWASC